MCAALSPTPPDSSTNSSISNFDNQVTDEKTDLMDHTNDENNNNHTNNKYCQPIFLHSFEAELDKVDEYFQVKAPDVRQAILDSLQRMYNENEWHDNPLTIICRDLNIHVPTSEQLMELKAARDELKKEYDELRRSMNN